MSEIVRSRRPGRLLWAVVAVLASVAVQVAGAPFGADPEQAAPLLEKLEEHYQILVLTDRYLLQPLSETAEAFESIEVKAGSVALDGEAVSRSRLAEVVGDDAALIFDLSALGSAEWAATEELRERIERLADERRLRAEEIEELIRSRVEELESLGEEHREVIADALEEQRQAEQRRDRRPRARKVRTDTRLSLGSSLTIDDNETSQDVVVLGGSLDVDGKVRGDAVVVGGSAEIRGEVSGTVTTVGGSIVLGPGGKIYGDAISIGGAVHRDADAEIYGEITEVSLGPGIDLDDLWHGIWIPGWHFDWFDFGIGELIARLGRTVLLGMVLLLILLLFPRSIAGVAERVEQEPWKAGLVGLGTQLLFLFALPVICFILAITLIGIPLVLILAPLAILALVAFLLLGFPGVATAGGRWLERRFDWRAASPYLLVVLGLVLIQGWSILGGGLGFLGGVLGFVGGPIKLAGWALLLLGFVIKYVAWTVGLGAVLLHQLSPRAAAAGSLPPGPPPPVPAPGMGELRRAAAWDDTKVDAETEPPPDPMIPEREPPPPPALPDPDAEYLRAAEDGSPAAGDEPEAPQSEAGEAKEAAEPASGEDVDAAPTAGKGDSS